MMSNIVTFKHKEKCKKIRDVIQNIHKVTCITSKCVFFSILFLSKNDDDIVWGRGMGSESYDRNYDE